MPSEKTLELKKQQVAALSESLKTACTGIIVDYKGISVAADTVLRKKLRESGNTYTVVKNTILGRALEAAGIPMAEADVTMIPQTWVELTDEDDIKTTEVPDTASDSILEDMEIMDVLNAAAFFMFANEYYYLSGPEAFSMVLDLTLIMDGEEIDLGRLLKNSIKMVNFMDSF